MEEEEFSSDSTDRQRDYGDVNRPWIDDRLVTELLDTKEGEGKKAGKKPPMARPRKTESEKKEKQRERTRRFKAKHVHLGDQVERWAMIKCLTEADSDSMVAKLLIDFYLENHTDLKLGPVTETTQRGTGQTGSHSFDTEEANGLESFGTKTDNCEIKVEVTAEDIAIDNTKTLQRDQAEMNFDTIEVKTEVNDDYITDDTDVGETAVDNTECTQRDKTKMNIDTVEVKIEVNDEDTTLSYAPGLDATVAKCDELVNSGSSKNKLLYRGNSLQEKNGRGTSKRKRLSDSISKLKQKKLKEVQ